MRRLLAASSILLFIVAMALPSGAVGGRPPERLKEQGLQGADELQAATNAVRALFRKLDVDGDGIRDLELVATVHGSDYWVIGDLDPTTLCSPTLFVLSTFGGCDVVKFERFAGPDGSETYGVTVVNGLNPLGPQGPEAQKALATIPEEFAAASRTVGTGGATGCTLASDAECRPLEINGVTYPHAYERLSAAFDSPRSPDLIVLQTSGGPDSPLGGHGHLSAIQSRASLLISGRGARRSPMDPDAEAALGIKHTDISATIAKAIGIEPNKKAKRLNGEKDQAARLLRQDGRSLDQLIEPQFNSFVIVLDGMEPELFDATNTPNIWELLKGNKDKATLYNAASGEMVSETNPNHTGILTGVLPQQHGIVSNSYLNRATGARVLMESPNLISAPTLFDAIESQKPWLRTAAVLGKEKLRLLFDCTKLATNACGPSESPEGVPVSHIRPDFLQGASTRPDQILQDPDRHSPAEPASGSGVTLDQFVMDQTIDLVKTEDPDFTLINMGQIDGFQHVFGPRSPEAIGAVRNADLQIGRLIEVLKETGKWEHSILFITADHSFAELNGTGDSVDVGGKRVAQPITGQVTGSRVILSERFVNSGIKGFVAHGGSAGIYLNDPSDASLAAQLAANARTMKDTLGRDVVTAAYCRIPSGGCPEIPAEWGLSHLRAGDVFLTTDDQHIFQVSRSEANTAVTGHHGGPSALPVPLIVASGGPYVNDDEVGTPVLNASIAPTISWIYGIDAPDSTPFPGAGKGTRVLSEAFAKHPMQAHDDGDIDEPVAKRALIVIFDANNSADMHCLVSQYQGPAAIQKYCGTTSSLFSPSLYPVPTLRYMLSRGWMAEYGSMASFPTVTFPNHNVVGSGAHPAHHDVVGNRYYEREQQRVEAPIDPTNVQNPVYFWSESLYGQDFETMHEATHRSFGDWMGPDNVDKDQSDGAYSASVNEPTVRGADYASLEPHRSLAAEPLFAARWGRPDELDSDTTRECAQRDAMGYGLESGLDHIGQGQARSLFDDPAHPDPRFLMLNFTLVDGSAHKFGPHTKCALSAYRDSAKRLGRVLDAVREAGTLGETLIVLTGDHGQENQRQHVGGGGFAKAFNGALSNSGVGYVLADNFMYLKTIDVAHPPLTSGSNTATFKVVDDDTGDAIGSAGVVVKDAATGDVLASGTTTAEQGGEKRMQAPLPRIISANGNDLQERLLGEGTVADMPTVVNPAHIASSGEVTLSFNVPASGVVVAVTRSGFSQRTLRFDGSGALVAGVSTASRSNAWGLTILALIAIAGAVKRVHSGRNVAL